MEKELSKKEFAKEFRDRTKNFAIRIIHFCKTLPRTQEGGIISNQLLRCGTSVGSNYRAVCRARSRNEFYSKLCIVVEEADETLFWLELIRDARIKQNETLNSLLKEAEENLSVVATARKTLS